eukprot:6078012-Karenia_brevis.AAC.1
MDRKGNVPRLSAQVAVLSSSAQLAFAGDARCGTGVKERKGSGPTKRTGLMKLFTIVAERSHEPI